MRKFLLVLCSIFLINAGGTGINMDWFHFSSLLKKEFNVKENPILKNGNQIQGWTITNLDENEETARSLTLSGNVKATVRYYNDTQPDWFEGMEGGCNFYIIFKEAATAEKLPDLLTACFDPHMPEIKLTPGSYGEMEVVISEINFMGYCECDSIQDHFTIKQILSVKEIGVVNLKNEKLHKKDDAKAMKFLRGF